MAYKHIYEELIAELEDRYDSFEIIYKDESKLHRFLSMLTFWMWRKNDDTEKWENLYMTKYISVIGHKVAFPSRSWHEEHPYPWKIIAHEGQHMWDDARLPVVYRLGYMLPQLLVTLVLGAFWNLWFLCALLAGLPLLSPGRSWAEKRGYTMNIACNYWVHGSVLDSTLEWITEQFTGSYYYFMWPFKKLTWKYFQKQKERVKSGAILAEEWPRVVHDIVVKNLDR